MEWLLMHSPAAQLTNVLCRPVLQSAISSAADNQQPKVFVSSSAVGYYGASQTSSFTEDSPAGNDYLAEICQGAHDCPGSAAVCSSSRCKRGSGGRGGSSGMLCVGGGGWELHC